MKQDKYNIAGTSYIQSMDDKATYYSSLIREAENTNRANYGKVTAAEAECYYDAVEVCKQIMNLNLSQREVYNQWKKRKEENEKIYKRIVDTLYPAPPKEPETLSQGNAAGTGSGLKKARTEEVATSTSDGFTTQYASKDVPVEMIKGWFKEDECNVPFSQIIGRTELKQRLLDEVASSEWEQTGKALGINPVKCYFLYGPPGTGKTFLIESLACELKSQGFKFMHLMGSQVHDKHVGVAEKIVETAFKVAIEKAPCLVFMDEIDNLCRPRAKGEGHEQRLTVAFLEAYNFFKKSNKRVIFMGATNHPGLVDDAMMDRITLIKVPLPAEEDRKGYFDRMTQADEKKGKAALVYDKGLTAEYMASKTDNYSYRDLDRIRDYILDQLKAMAMKDYRVLDANGNLDRAASDKRAVKAILDGEIKITQALFEKALKDNVPSDKTDIRQELKEFEERVAAVQAG